MKENSKREAFVFFGRSGSGKGTQAGLLMDYIKKTREKESIYIETGERFRDFIEKPNFVAKRVKEVMDTGGLLPVFLPIWIWTDKIIESYTGEQTLVLDGLCRRPDEAPVLDSALKFFQVEKPTIIFVKTSFEWSFERLKSRGRKDDTDEYIKSRLEWFDTNVFPAMAYFWGNKDYNFFEVDGEKSIEEVHAEIIKKIEAAK